LDLFFHNGALYDAKDRRMIRVFNSAFTILPLIRIIGSGCFINSVDVRAISIPDTVTILESFAFFGSGLENVVIPANVVKIGESCFNKCEQLRTVGFVDPSNLEIIESYAFADTAISGITVPASVRSFDRTSFGSISLDSIHFETPESELRNGLMFCASFSSVTHCFSDDSVVSIPMRVSCLGDRCFFGCNKLKRIRFVDLDDDEETEEETAPEVVIPDALRCFVRNNGLSGRGLLQEEIK
jgi:hypothetical protein